MIQRRRLRERSDRARRGRRLALATLAFVAAGWLVTLAATFALSRRFGVPELEPMPCAASRSIEKLRLTTSDGSEIGAWLLASDAPGASIVMAYGWRGSRSTRRAAPRASTTRE